MVLAGDPERLVDLGAGVGDFLMPVIIKSVDRLMDRQRRRIGRDEGNIAAAAIGPPAAFVTRLWLSALAWWRPSTRATDVAACTFLPYVLRGRSLCLNPDSSHIALPRPSQAGEWSNRNFCASRPGPWLCGRISIGRA
jgi:hypothetical protein